MSVNVSSDHGGKCFRVVNVFKLWIEQHLYDDDEAAVLRAVIHFATTSVTDPIQAQQLVRIAERRVRRLYVLGCSLLVIIGPDGRPAESVGRSSSTDRVIFIGWAAAAFDLTSEPAQGQVPRH
jgi:hypothetical protein